MQRSFNISINLDCDGKNYFNKNYGCNSSDEFHGNNKVKCYFKVANCPEKLFSNACTHKNLIVSQLRKRITAGGTRKERQQIKTKGIRKKTKLATIKEKKKESILAQPSIKKRQPSKFEAIRAQLCKQKMIEKNRKSINLLAQRSIKARRSKKTSAERLRPSKHKLIEKIKESIDSSAQPALKESLNSSAQPSLKESIDSSAQPSLKESIASSAAQHSIKETLSQSSKNISRLYPQSEKGKGKLEKVKETLPTDTDITSYEQTIRKENREIGKQGENTNQNPKQDNLSLFASVTKLSSSLQTSILPLQSSEQRDANISETLSKSVKNSAESSPSFGKGKNKLENVKETFPTDTDIKSYDQPIKKENREIGKQGENTNLNSKLDNLSSRVALPKLSTSPLQISILPLQSSEQRDANISETLSKSVRNSAESSPSFGKGKNKLENVKETFPTDTDIKSYDQPIKKENTEIGKQGENTNLNSKLDNLSSRVALPKLSTSLQTSILPLQSSEQRDANISETLSKSVRNSAESSPSFGKGKNKLENVKETFPTDTDIKSYDQPIKKENTEIGKQGENTNLNSKLDNLSSRVALPKLSTSLQTSIQPVQSPEQRDIKGSETPSQSLKNIAGSLPKFEKGQEKLENVKDTLQTDTVIKSYEQSIGKENTEIGKQGENTNLNSKLDNLSSRVALPKLSTSPLQISRQPLQSPEQREIKGSETPSQSLKNIAGSLPKFKKGKEKLENVKDTLQTDTVIKSYEQSIGKENTEIANQGETTNLNPKLDNLSSRVALPKLSRSLQTSIPPSQSLEQREIKVSQTPSQSHTNVSGSLSKFEKDNEKLENVKDTLQTDSDKNSYQQTINKENREIGKQGENSNQNQKLNNLSSPVALPKLSPEQRDIKISDKISKSPTNISGLLPKFEKDKKKLENVKETFPIDKDSKSYQQPISQENVKEKINLSSNVFPRTESENVMVTEIRKPQPNLTESSYILSHKLSSVAYQAPVKKTNLVVKPRHDFGYSRLHWSSEKKLTQKLRTLVSSSPLKSPTIPLSLSPAKNFTRLHWTH